MSILFRCPCGRSMVVESDRAGAVVICPNCRRSLKVPSGQGRGVQLSAAPAATKTRTSRRCQHCGKDVPVDSQMCPHCRAILMDGPAPAAGGGEAEGSKPEGIVYGGSRETWWTRLTPGAKAGILGGAAAFVLVLCLITYFGYKSWYAGQIQLARTTTVNALTDGRKLEVGGKFQEAYDRYRTTEPLAPYLRDAGNKTKDLLDKDNQMADSIQARLTALKYLGRDVTRAGESIYWKPDSPRELEEAQARLRELAPTYREWVKGLCTTALNTIRAAKAKPDQAAFDQQFGQVMDQYVNFVSTTTDPQRKQYSFQRILTGLQAMGSAARNWTNAASRNQYLLNAEAYLDAVKEDVAAGQDALWQG